MPHRPNMMPLIALPLIAAGFVRAADTAPAGDARIDTLIRQLGHENFKQREAAQYALIKIGPAAKEKVRQAAADKDRDVATRAAAVARVFDWMEQAEGMKTVEAVASPSGNHVALRFNNTTAAIIDTSPGRIYHRLDFASVFTGLRTITAIRVHDDGTFELQGEWRDADGKPHKAAMLYSREAALLDVPTAREAPADETARLGKPKKFTLEQAQPDGKGKADRLFLSLDLGEFAENMIPETAFQGADTTPLRKTGAHLFFMRLESGGIMLECIGASCTPVAAKAWEGDGDKRLIDEALERQAATRQSRLAVDNTPVAFKTAGGKSGIMRISQKEDTAEVEVRFLEQTKK